MKTKSPPTCFVSSGLYLACVTVIIIGAAVWTTPALAQEKLTLKVIKVDSEETSGEDGKAANAVDRLINVIEAVKIVRVRTIDVHTLVNHVKIQRAIQICLQ